MSDQTDYFVPSPILPLPLLIPFTVTLSHDTRNFCLHDVVVFTSLVSKSLYFKHRTELLERYLKSPVLTF